MNVTRFEFDNKESIQRRTARVFETTPYLLKFDEDNDVILNLKEFILNNDLSNIPEKYLIFTPELLMKAIITFKNIQTTYDLLLLQQKLQPSFIPILEQIFEKRNEITILEDIIKNQESSDRESQLLFEFQNIPPSDVNIKNEYISTEYLIKGNVYSSSLLNLFDICDISSFIQQIVCNKYYKYERTCVEIESENVITMISGTGIIIMERIDENSVEITCNTNEDIQDIIFEIKKSINISIINVKIIGQIGNLHINYPIHLYIWRDMVWLHPIFKLFTKFNETIHFIDTMKVVLNNEIIPSKIISEEINTIFSYKTTLINLLELMYRKLFTIYINQYLLIYNYYQEKVI